MRVAGPARRWQERIQSEISTWTGSFPPKQGYERAASEADTESGSEDSYEKLLPSPPSSNIVGYLVNSIIIFLSLICTIALYTAFPFPTTIPLFIGCAICLSGWVFSSWCRFVNSLLRSKRLSCLFASWSIRCLVVLCACTALVSYWIALGVTAPTETYPALRPGVQEKFFIAAILYNNEAMLGDWSEEVLKLASYLGEENTFVSIFESNSWDDTKNMLGEFRTTLDKRGIGNRIVLEDNDDRWWPYGTAPERIEYLAASRNRALEPLQSDDASIRLDDYDSFDRIIFLNDIRFTWQSMARLIATRLDGDSTQPPDYDLACSMDYAWSGLYDTWASRDICGTPLRAFWPYVKDKSSIERVKREVPFPVATCWNGAVVFPAGPYLWREEPAEGRAMRKRGWRMIDLPTYPGSQMSPAIKEPLKFRSSQISACDHSESFLFSYDLYRLYDRPPRIYMNPTVKVTYDTNWFIWHNYVLRIGFVKWWVEHWSRGYPLLLVDWIWEAAGRRRDYCTWAGLKIPDTCPALPGPPDLNWSQ